MAYIILEILIVIGDLSEVPGPLILQCPRQELRRFKSNLCDVACTSPYDVSSFDAGPFILVLLG